VYNAIFGLDGKDYKVKYKQYLLESYDEDGSFGYDFLMPIVSYTPIDTGKESNTTINS